MHQTNSRIDVNEEEFGIFDCTYNDQSMVVIPVATQAATPDIPDGATLIFAEDFESG